MNKTNVLLVMFLTMILFVSCNTDAMSQEVTGPSIYEKYKDAICLIITTTHFKEGAPKSKGGSGFFIDKEGHVLTAAHVVKLELVGKISRKQLDSVDRYTYWVVIPSRNRKYRAKLVGSIDYADIALLQVQNIDPSEYESVKIGDPSKLKIGDRDWAIGNPNYLANSLTSGIISSLHRNIGMHYIDDFIQTDCPINHGNSGCPVFNEQEEVIGIANAIHENCDGLAFAQSIALAKINLLKKGDIELPTPGFEALLSNFPRDGENRDSPGSEDLAFIERKTDIEYIGDKMAIAKETWSDHCAIITSIDEFENPYVNEKTPSAARKAGLARGDLIISIDGKPIANGMDIRIFMIDKKAGDSVVIVYERSIRGKMVTKIANLTLTKRINPSDNTGTSNNNSEEEAKASGKKR